MLSKLPISLAQLKTGNNSEKLKNEIRQLLYLLYGSKKLTKQLYKSLVDIIYYTWKNIKSTCNNNKFKTSAPTWNDTFDLPDGSYSIANIQNSFEFIIKKHETLTENPPI